MTQFASTLYPQTNPTNPILLAFREDPDPAIWAAASFAAEAFGGYQIWEVPGDRFHSFTTASAPQVSHAVGVITRLASLTKVGA